MMNRTDQKTGLLEPNYTNRGSLVLPLVEAAARDARRPHAAAFEPDVDASESASSMIPPLGISCVLTFYTNQYVISAGEPE